MKQQQQDKPREIKRSTFLTSVRDESTELPATKVTQRTSTLNVNKTTFGVKSSSVSPARRTFRAAAALEEEKSRSPPSYFDINLVR